MRSPVARLVPFGILLIAACSDQVPTSPVGAAPAFHRTALGGLPVSALWQDTVQESLDGGSTYGMYVPVNWNGDVAYYAHGFVAPDLPVGLPANDDAVPFRDALGALGYAVAYSSYSSNGYDFREGLQRTRDLRGKFRARYGTPAHDFLVGHSLGSQIVEALAEEHGRQYDGALAMCGVLGGTRRQLDYVGQTRTVFDFFYPGVLPGTTTQMPAITSAELNARVVGPAYAAVLANPSGFGAMTLLDQTPLAGRNATEKLTTLLNVLGYQALGANDVFQRANNEGTFDNMGLTYSSAFLPPSLLVALNSAVARYDAGKHAERWMERNYEPTGDLGIPMLTLHKRYDRLVPFAHEAAYRDVVTAAGAGAKLRQRTVDDYGHCEFGVDTMVSNFQDLVHWVESGTVPVV